jgi:hypothetical protein
VSDDDVVKLDRRLLSQSRVIAAGRGILDLNRLLSRYGGRARDWTKKSSQVILIRQRRAEVHWYECRGIGRVEQKIKWIDEP